MSHPNKLAVLLILEARIREFASLKATAVIISAYKKFLWDPWPGTNLGALFGKDRKLWVREETQKYVLSIQ